MDRTARRRSTRHRAIFRRHPGLRLLQTTIIAALSTTVSGCISDRNTAPREDAGSMREDAAGDARMTDARPVDGSTRDATPRDGGASACEDPQPVLDPSGRPTGVIRCADESLNRVEQVACEPINVGNTCPEGGTQNSADTCSVDADCSEKPNGACLVLSTGKGLDACRCQYACETDNDCADDWVCLCAGVAGVSSLCKPGQCTVNTDCASGECAVITGEGGCGVSTFTTCRQAEDTCRSYADCDFDGRFEGCMSYADGLKCEQLPVCGRPLTVSGETRMADTLARQDWTTPASPSLEGLSENDRLALTDWWTGIAALEHASVASFGRFTLELMRYGAPADLLADTQAAAADEVDHAQLAYGLAGAYAGQVLGPGPLEVDGVSLSASKVEAVAHLVSEACLGETLGAAEARAMAEAADDPVVADICGRIAEDEARHAALAWRSLAWFLGDDEILKEAAGATLKEAIAAHFQRSLPRADCIPSHGLLGDQVRHTLHRDTIESVVIPCAASLGIAVA